MIACISTNGQADKNKNLVNTENKQNNQLQNMKVQITNLVYLTLWSLRDTDMITFIYLYIRIRGQILDIRTH